MKQPNERLLPCRECGAPCREEHFEGPHIEGRVTLWLCSQHRFLGGKCPSDTAYLTEEAWNTRVPAVQDEGMVERCAKIAESHATCGCNGKHGACVVDDLANAIAADIRSLYGGGGE